MVILKQNRKTLRTLLFLAAFCGLVVYAALQNRGTEQPALTLSDEASRTAWLELRGWQVGTPEVTQMRVPDSWQTPAGQSWLRLQSAQGLHPEDYAGCAAERYLYPVQNTGSDYMYAELILCGDILIGAQIYDASTQLMQSVI